MNKDVLVGTTYGDKSQLTVLELMPERRSTKKVYKVRCSICANDPELWGEPTFEVLRPCIVKGNIPCGCSYNPHWTVEQYETLVKRICEDRSYIFHGFCEWQGVQTRIKLSCKNDGNYWESLTISRMFTGHGCPSCAITSRSLKDEHWIEKLMSTGNFLEGTIFNRSNIKGSDGRERSWNYTCPKCSNDSFVKAGVCSGIFTSPLHSLLAGSKSCRCSLSYRSNKEQKEHQIDKIVKGENLDVSFVGWPNGYLDGDSKISLKCGEHGEWDVRYSSFVSQNTRCPGCATTGYSQNIPGNLYLLQYENIVKVGITNRDVPVRVLEINKSSNKTFKEIFILSSEDGRVPKVLEKDILDMFKAKYQNVDDSFDGSSECFIDVNTSEVINYIKSGNVYD